ncbi:MAG: response regulator [candidate division KSB1 bacterium]|nr:response regulator [candidate division KSB1 bacterium]
MESAKIVVADDEFAVVRSVCRLLARAGYCCLPARDGEEALQLVQSEKPSAILLDLDMPGINGLEVLRQLKADPELRHIPVCILSAIGTFVQRDGTPLEHAWAVMPKPFEPRGLLHMVREMLRNPEREQAGVGPEEILPL